MQTVLLIVVLGVMVYSGYRIVKTLIEIKNKRDRHD